MKKQFHIPHLVETLMVNSLKKLTKNMGVLSSLTFICMNKTREDDEECC